MARRQQRPYTISFLGTMAIVTALLIFMYATTFEAYQGGVIISAVLLLVVGLVFAWIMVGVRFEPFQLAHMVESIVWTALSVGAIWLVNMQVPFNLDVSPMSNQLFSILMGVAEECFFRVWLATFINKVTRFSLLAIGVSSGIWSVYHISRYGGNMSAFFIIFMAGIFLGFVMLYSKMADGVIFAHALVNYLATA